MPTIKAITTAVALTLIIGGSAQAQSYEPEVLSKPYNDGLWDGRLQGYDEGRMDAQRDSSGPITARRDGSGGIDLELPGGRTVHCFLRDNAGSGISLDRQHRPPPSPNPAAPGSSPLRCLDPPARQPRGTDTHAPRCSRRRAATDGGHGNVGEISRVPGTSTPLRGVSPRTGVGA